MILAPVGRRPRLNLLDDDDDGHVPPITATAKPRLCFNDDEDDRGTLPVKKAPVVAIKRPRLCFEDDDDGEVKKVATVVKRPRVTIPPPEPLAPKRKRHVSVQQLKRAKSTTASSSSSSSSSEILSPNEIDLTTKKFLHEITHDMKHSTMSELVSELPPGTVLPANRPAVPTQVTPAQPIPLEQELDTVRKNLSVTARACLDVMLRHRPNVKARRHDSRSGPSLSHIPPAGLKGPARPVMRINTFQFDQQLMYFAGKRESPLRPGFMIEPLACYNDEKCIGMASTRLPVRETPSGITAVFRPGPLMAFHNAEELTALYQFNTKPAVHRECIKCLRYLFNEAALYVKGAGPGSIGEGWGISSMQVQSFGNTVGGDTGYAPEHCTQPMSGSVCNGLIVPLAHDDDRKQFIEYDTETKGWRINQYGMASDVIRNGDQTPKALWRYVRSKYQEDFPAGAASK